MFARLLPALFTLCLLASLNGFGMHVHWHEHGVEQAHSHVVSALDADHALAHAHGSVDDDSSKLGSRTGPELPQMGPVTASALDIQVEGVPSLLPLLADQRVTGPPRFLTPPSQAPPQASLTV